MSLHGKQIRLGTLGLDRIDVSSGQILTLLGTTKIQQNQAPIFGIDLTNKTYVDNLFGSISIGLPSVLAMNNSTNNIPLISPDTLSSVVIENGDVTISRSKILGNIQNYLYVSDTEISLNATGTGISGKISSEVLGNYMIHNVANFLNAPINEVSQNATTPLGVVTLQQLISSVSGSISGTINYISKFTSANVIGNSQIFDNGTNVGIGNILPSYKLDITGTFQSYLNTSSSMIYDGELTLNGLNGGIGGGSYLKFTAIPARSYNLIRSSSDLGFSADGTYSNMIIKNNGNVGLRTENPTATIHMIGIDSTSTNYALKIDNSSLSSLLNIKNDGTTQFGTGFKILSGGNSASVTGTFPIFGGYGGSFEAAYLGITSDISLGGALQISNSGFSKIYGNGNYGIIYSSTGGDELHDFRGKINIKTSTSISTNFGFKIDNSISNNIFNITETGKVGIGLLTVPNGGKLHVINNTSETYIARFESSSNNPVLQIKDDETIGVRISTPERHLDIRGDLQIRRVQDAYSLGTTIDSYSTYHQGSYWDGSSAQSVFIRQQLLVTSNSPTYTLNFTTHIGGIIVSFANNGDITFNGLSGVGTRLVNVDSTGKLITGSLVSSLIGGSGTINYIPKWTPSGTTLGNSILYDNGISVIIGSTTAIGTFGIQSQLANSYLFGNDNANTFGQIRYGAGAFHRINFFEGGGGTGQIDYVASRVDSYFDMFRFLNMSGTEIVRMSSNGNVGFNTASASAIVHVVGIDTTSSNYVAKFENSLGTPIARFRNDGFTTIYSNSAQLFAETLQVGGTILVNQQGYLIRDGNGTDFWQMFAGSRTFGIMASGLSTILTIDVNNPYTITTHNAYNIGFGITTPTARLHLQGIDSLSTNYALKVYNSSLFPLLNVRNDGNVGINTGTTDANLVIKATNYQPGCYVMTDINDNETAFGILNSTSSTWQARWFKDGMLNLSGSAYDSTTRLKILGADSTSSNYVIKTDNSSSTPLFYVANNGSVGIGNIASNTRLYVQASTTVGDFIFKFTDGYGSNIMKADVGGFTSFGQNISIGDYVTPTALLEITKNATSNNQYLGFTNTQPSFNYRYFMGINSTTNLFRLLYDATLNVERLTCTSDGRFAFNTTADAVSAVTIIGTTSDTTAYTLKLKGSFSENLFYVRNNGSLIALPTYNDSTNSGTTGILGIDNTGKFFNTGVTTTTMGSVLTTSNKNMLALATTASGQQIGSAITITPYNHGYIQVFMQGIKLTVGDGVNTSEVYFANSGTLNTPKLIANIVAGDVLVRGTGLGYNSSITDSLEYEYQV